MRRCLHLAILGALAIAGASCGDDEPATGTRGPCASGGAIHECDLFEPTPEAACERLVQCGVSRESDGFDYTECVRELHARGTRGTLDFTLACIAASSCDEAGYCLELGGG